MIKLFIFDLDGVITSTSNEHFMAWKRVIKDRFSIDVDDAVEELTKGVSRMQSLNRILESIGLSQSISDEEKMDIAYTKNELYKSLISNFNENNIFPGVLKLFKYLKEKNILIALGSASKNGPTLISRLGIKDYFDYIVDPANLNSKPHPDIFNKAMKHFDLLPGECVGIEDAISGVTSIKSANMYAIGIGDKEQLNHADVVFKNINEINFKFLENLIEGDHG
jgi:beta-phosphoglucomutase